MDMNIVQDSLPQALAAFSLDLYHELSKENPSKNIFFSPMSISAVLSMVLLGAKGNSKIQMEKVLHFDQTAGCMRPPASERTVPEAVPGHQEERAPHCQEEGGIASEFRSLLSQLNKLSGVYQLDVANNSFMQKGYAFLQFSTSLMGFVLLLIVNHVFAIQVEKAMTCENVASWISLENMREKDVKVYLPRFKLEDTFDLKSTLKAMGMIDVFDQAKADLSGMSSFDQLFLSAVIHKTYVGVNELGTEAAAATGAVVSNRAIVSYELFLADHQFLFCILHNPTKTILFLGKLCSP
ncbi:serpin B12-like [Tiliqua scincoides]|uniref:serpin B12-like n=1 Tax=Tiliqua scincoides TaxID=71010 RepID=UPI0034634259